jgi:hypothetical protein
MKGCNTLTLCPVQMHEAIEYWLKQRVLRGDAQNVEVVEVSQRAGTTGTRSFDVDIREKAPSDEADDY